MLDDFKYLNTNEALALPWDERQKYYKRVLHIKEVEYLRETIKFNLYANMGSIVFDHILDQCKDEISREGLIKLLIELNSRLIMEAVGCEQETMEYAESGVLECQHCNIPEITIGANNDVR